MSVIDSNLITFGPVPSRRLGRSLGINNIPSKYCSYSCLYCQVGRTVHKQAVLQKFYQPEEIFQAARSKVFAVQAEGEKIDYLTFVPDGEPTLDIYLGETIDRLRSLNIKIAVITNASLLWHEEVQAALNKTDLVSVKLDTVDELQWQKINRPHESLKLSIILQGIEMFSRQYPGKLITETMLVEGVNDNSRAINGVADFLEALQPAEAYIAVPTRPTTEANIFPPGEAVIVQAYAAFSQKVAHVEYLIGYEGSDFVSTGDIERDLLSITAVHPMREEAVNEMLNKAGLGWELIQSLLDNNKLKKVEFAGKHFYVRLLPINE